MPIVSEFELVHDPSVGEAEPWYVNDHTVFRDRGGTWHLIGITHAEPFAPFDELHLCHATAPALHGPWTKHPYALSTDPAAGETHLWAPHVIDHDGRYWMFYCGGGASPAGYRIHLATSEDGWNWTRHEANPLVVDGYEARDPMVRRVDDRWVMYYTATSSPEGGNHVVGAVESDDLLRWSGRRVVYTDRAEGTGGGPTESPFVFERDGWWYLLVGPDSETIEALLAPEERALGDRPGEQQEAASRPRRSGAPEDRGRRRERRARIDRAYRTTRVLASRDPYAFDADGVVGTIDAHAPEVVVVEAGEDAGWWITHCGWGQGGVWLASLTWPA